MSSKHDDGDEGKEIVLEDDELAWGTWPKAEGKDGAGDGNDSKDAPISSEELLEKVQEFFYGDEDLASTLELWVDQHSDVVDNQNEEFKLEYTTLFHEYRDLFEKHIENYILKIGGTPEQLYAALQEKMEEDKTGNEAIFGHILIAVTDFDIFMTMMRESSMKIGKK